jgi:hypothetical protein
LFVFISGLTKILAAESATAQHSDHEEGQSAHHQFAVRDTLLVCSGIVPGPAYSWEEFNRDVLNLHDRTNLDELSTWFEPPSAPELEHDLLDRLQDGRMLSTALVHHVLRHMVGEENINYLHASEVAELTVETLTG